VSERKVGNNLLAMGTAAVLGIYATGYTRTAGAAQKMADSEGHRGTPPPVVAQAFPEGAPAPRSSGQAQPTAPSQTAEATAPSPADTAPAGGETPASAAPSPVTPKADSSPTPSTGGKAAPDKTVVAAPAPAAAPQLPATPPFPVADSAVAPPWYDGTFYGWGRSRHGDIRAGVEIAGGKIARAWVEGCYTRYSCDRIASLIPQVAERQNPEIDNVSGATQSSDAFYYGVLEALGQAKK
jgi:uncharacterized protein with FMN-binding domain